MGELVEAKTISGFLGDIGTRQSLLNTLGSEKDVKTFTANLISVVTNNKVLQECTPMTLVSGALLANELKLSLSPSLGHCYLVPFKNNKEGTTTAQFIVGWKGLFQFAMRTGQYRHFPEPIALKQGEIIKPFNPKTEEIEISLIENEEERDKLPTVGYLASFTLSNGFTKTIYWSYSKMLVHADKYSAAFNKDRYKDLLDGKIPKSDLWKYSSFWYKNFDEMAKKTMMRQLISKFGIVSIELVNAFEKDDDREYISAEQTAADVRAEAKANANRTLLTPTPSPAQTETVDPATCEIKDGGTDAFPSWAFDNGN